MIEKCKVATGFGLAFLTATGAASPSGKQVSTKPVPAVVSVTISQNQGNMPVDGEFYAMNQSCEFYVYILKDNVAQDVWNDWDVYWSSRMGDQIHEYPHAYVTGSQVGGEQINVLVRDKRDASVGTASAEIQIDVSGTLINCSA